MIDLLKILLPVGYVIVTALYTWRFFSDSRRFGTGLIIALVLTLGLHIFYLYSRITLLQHFPTTSPAELLSLIALAMGIIYLWIEFRLNVQTTGVFVLSVITVFQVLSSAFITSGRLPDPLLSSPLFSLHTSAAILGYSAIAISALYATLYLLLFYDIKGSKFSIVYSRLPALEVLDSMHIKAATAGFSFLTFTIILGIVWLKLTFDQVLLLDWKIVTAFITWGIFGVVLASYRLFRWSGKRLAYFSLSGFMTIVISLTVVNYFLTSFHRFP